MKTNEPSPDSFPYKLKIDSSFIYHVCPLQTVFSQAQLLLGNSSFLHTKIKIKIRQCHQLPKTGLIFIVVYQHYLASQESIEKICNSCNFFH